MHVQLLEESRTVQRNMALAVMGPVTGPSKEEALYDHFDDMMDNDGGECLLIEGESCFAYDDTLAMHGNELKQVSPFVARRVIGF